MKPIRTKTQSEFGIVLKADPQWSRQQQRVLIILETIPHADLKRGELASDQSLPNTIAYATRLARKIQKVAPAFAVINFNDKKSLHLKANSSARLELETGFKARCLALIKELNPTHILFSGDVNKLYPVENAALKNGWVHNFEGIKVVSTLDFSRLLENSGEYSNLLGFFCRHLANLLIGYNPYNLQDLKVKPYYVDTLEKFDKMMEQWDTAKEVAFDTETKNLSVLQNAIYTAQFCFDTQPTIGYVVPINHPKTPFTKPEIVHIKKRLRKAFGASQGPTLITFNGIFDLYVARTALKLNIMHLRVWECMAAEHLLDENFTAMAGLGIKLGGLAAVLCSYNNDAYISGAMAFSKAERNTTGSIDPSDPDFLKYAATDVVCLHGIKKCELLRASHQELENNNYKPYFVRHMMYQMSDTVHTLSHLKECGSLIDKKYLQSLLKPESKLAAAISELQDEFKTIPLVQQANAALLEDSGFKSASLFGGSTQWTFSFTKSTHKAKLFFDVMGLKAISQTATGADAVDKEFIEHYKDSNIVVSMFAEFQEATKLLSTYVKGWYKILTTDLDGVTDSHLRSSYKFLIDTGRLGSSDPNLQNIPARGKLAKIIKEAFICPDSHLLLRFDYSAHEVRGWSIVSNDKGLADAFRAGQELRQQLIKNPTDKIRTELKTKGDLHIQNVKRFLGKWVEKSDPLRDAVKGIVFG